MRASDIEAVEGLISRAVVLRGKLVELFQVFAVPNVDLVSGCSVQPTASGVVESLPVAKRQVYHPIRPLREDSAHTGIAALQVFEDAEVIALRTDR